MRNLVCVLSICLALATVSLAQTPEYVVDSNTAFYEGESDAFVISPPSGFVLVTTEANRDGYSFAFVPENQTYDSADVWIDVTIMKLGENNYESVVAADTSQIRTHYGGAVTLTAVDSVFDFNGNPIPTVYVNDSSRFIPTVMVSYCNGGGEIVIFELVIVEGGLPRFLAERVYTDCLQRFKMLTKATAESLSP